MNKNKINTIVNSTELSKSEKIRQLFVIGVSKGDISRLLNIKYQFVRNVLLREIEKLAKNSNK